MFLRDRLISRLISYIFCVQYHSENDFSHFLAYNITLVGIFRVLFKTLQGFMEICYSCFPMSYPRRPRTSELCVRVRKEKVGVASFFITKGPHSTGLFPNSWSRFSLTSIRVLVTLFIVSFSTTKKGEYGGKCFWIAAPWLPYSPGRRFHSRRRHGRRVHLWIQVPRWEFPGQIEVNTDPITSEYSYLRTRVIFSNPHYGWNLSANKKN